MHRCGVIVFSRSPAFRRAFNDVFFRFVLLLVLSRSNASLTELEPEFVEPIKNVTAEVGGEATLSCAVSNLGQNRVVWSMEDLQITLSINHDVIARNARITISRNDEKYWNLHIRNVQESDQGNYSCSINTTPIKSVFGYLEVVAPRPKFVEPIKNVTAEIGDEATLSCAINHLGSHRVAWINVDQHAILAIQHHVITRQQRVTVSRSGEMYWNLHIRNVQESDQGNYSCAINTIPEKSTVGYLEVVAPRPKFVEPIKNVTAEIGGEATLSCAINHLGSHRMAWIKVDQQTILAVQHHVITRKQRVTVSRSGEMYWNLHIRNIQESDQGNYSCSISTNPVKSIVGYLEVVEQIVDNNFFLATTESLHSEQDPSFDNEFTTSSYDEELNQPSTEKPPVEDQGDHFVFKWIRRWWPWPKFLRFLKKI